MIDITQPFLAIVPDAAEGGYFDPTHAVYLVNPLGEALENVVETTGGFFSGDDGVVEAEPRSKGPYTVAPGSAFELERSSQDEFDELVCWWEIVYEFAGSRREVQFSAGKRLSETVVDDACPFLGCRALLPTRSEQR